MAQKKRYILFLHHRYVRREIDFYLKRLRGAVTVAVDGGVRFFLRNNIKPDILIGDLDSAPRLSKRYLQDVELITHPPEKDKTDTQLALELALERGASDIEICGAVSRSEIDHTIGNVLLLDLVCRFNRRNRTNVSAKLISPDWEAQLVENRELTLMSKKGNFLSVIPLSDSCRIEYSGLLYPAPKRRLKFGDTLTLRNRFTGRRARIKVTGRAIVAIVRK